MKLISINIPTFNSEKTLGLCLEAIKKNGYQNYEIVIVDGGSTDKTIEIAKSFGAKICLDENSLLHARYTGVENSEGEFVLVLDSDQIIESDLLERLEKLIDSFDMVVLEETVYSKKTFLENLFYLDRKLIHRVRDIDPKTSVLLPRFFKKDILVNVFKKINPDILKNVSGQDHAIIYYEAYQLSQKVGYIEKAVKHMEPSSVLKLVKKFYRWGYTSTSVKTSSEYKELFQQKEGFRKGTINLKHPVESLASITLILIKGVPAYAGRFKYILDKRQGKI